MDQLISGSQAEFRAATVFVSTFGVIALILVAAGVFSVVARAAAEWRRNLAIRSPFGAHPRQVVAAAMRTAAAGLAVGGLVALGATRVMASLLFGVGTFDTVTWVGACAAHFATCAAAGFLGERRAARIDPMSALGGG